MNSNLIANQHEQLIDIFKKNKFQVVLLIGERSTGKTTDACFCVLFVLIWNIQLYIKTKKLKKIVIMRENAGSIKTTIFQTLVNCYLKLSNLAILNHFTELQETQVTGKEAGISWIFTQGFKTANKKETAKNKGLESVNTYIIDEAEEISKGDFEQLKKTGIRENAVIVLICNTPSKNHWITQTFLNLKPTKFDGFFDFEAKPLKHFTLIRSRLIDNPFLTEEVKENYQDFDFNNHTKDELENYCRDVLGLVTSNVKCQIFTKYQTCTDDEFDDIDKPSKYGLDFGFSNDQTALVAVKEYQGCLYVRQLIYELGLTNSLLDKRMKEITSLKKIKKLKQPKSSRKITNLAELKRLKQIDFSQASLIKADGGGLGIANISELKSKYGWNIEAVKKGAGSVEAGINKIKEYKKVFICAKSQDVLEEFNNYSYILDGNKEATTTPQDKHNHSIDAIRYAITEDNKETVKLDKYEFLFNN